MRFLLFGVFMPALALGQRVELRVESQEISAEMPFVLSVVVSGFDEDPQPTVSLPAIAGCKVTLVGVSPNVSSSITIVNGQVTQQHDVTFVFRYRVEAPRPGDYQIEPVTVSQGARSVTSQPTAFTATDVPSSDDMKVRLELPNWPLWVGETFDTTLVWYLRRDVRDQTFSVPLLEQSEWIEVRNPPQPASGKSRNTITIAVGAKELALPFERDQGVFDGSSYTRFRFPLRLTPLRAGRLDIAPTRVLAQVQVGVGRDAFGFPSARSRLFKAEDQARALEIRALPMTGRPASFSNAVGRGFSLEVQADRTVVRVGDPIELRFLLRGEADLQGLMLPALESMGFSSQTFSLPQEPPAGEVQQDSNGSSGKLFRATVRLKSERVTEIPPLGFTFFEPGEGKFQTVNSQPIALSVRGSAVVGADSVVGDTVVAVATPLTPPAQKDAFAIDADLALSASATTLRQAPRTPLPLLVGLYAVPIMVLLLCVQRSRTRDRRELNALVRRALRQVENEIKRAENIPAVDGAAAIGAALRALLRARGRPPSQLGPFVARMEEVAFAPDAQGAPVPEALREEALRWARMLVRDTPAAAGTGVIATAAVLACAMTSTVHAAAATPALNAARAAYDQALATADPNARRSEFAQAAALYRALADAHPVAPELLADWGNAALAARDFGTAVIAYRRALELNPRLDRARKNLGWVRSRMGDFAPHDASIGQGAVDSFFFWCESTTLGERHVVAGAAFALALLLLSPWPIASVRRRVLRLGALLPALLWIAMVGSIAIDRERARDAVVTVETTLRSADSPSAPAALDREIPAGVEVIVLEQRPSWTRIALSTGTQGWLSSGTMTYVSDDNTVGRP